MGVCELSDLLCQIACSLKGESLMVTADTATSELFALSYQLLGLFRDGRASVSNENLHFGFLAFHAPLQGSVDLNDPLGELMREEQLSACEDAETDVDCV